MLPIIEDFDYKRWYGIWTNIDNLDTCVFSDILISLILMVMVEIIMVYCIWSMVDGIWVMVHG